MALLLSMQVRSRVGFQSGDDTIVIFCRFQFCFNFKNIRDINQAGGRPELVIGAQVIGAKRQYLDSIV